MADGEGAVVSLSFVPVGHVAIPHLSSHVETFELARGGIVKVRIIYSSHCWSRKHDADADGGSIKFMDGITTMDKGVYIVQDFTKKRDRMIDATSRLISSPGIHLQRIFYEANTGIGKGKRVASS